MKYLDEYRDAELAMRYAQASAEITTRPWTLMEVCGGQTHAIVKFGIDDLLPPAITLLHGPGCPACVPPIDQLDQAVTRAKASGPKLAWLFIDLDGFKPVNDKFGHAVGDAVLKVVGQRLAHCVRASDLFARIGGDEFVVVLAQEPGGEDVATRIAAAIIGSIEAPIRDPDIGQALSASIGVGVFPDHAADATALLKVADEQMYQAKRKGKGTVSVAT